MTIEEKAKAYDEAIKIAKETYNTQPMYRNWLGSMFHELEESEEERIRKEIIATIHLYYGEPLEDEAKEMIAWLEKQGEQKPAIEMKTPEESLGVDSDTYNKIVDECVYGEQKPADNVEPKFKVGDWVVNNYGDVWHIDSFDKKNYQVSDGKGNYNYFPIAKQDEMHLWTIQDAKDAHRT